MDSPLLRKKETTVYRPIGCRRRYVTKFAAYRNIAYKRLKVLRVCSGHKHPKLERIHFCRGECHYRDNDYLFQKIMKRYVRMLIFSDKNNDLILKELGYIFVTNKGRKFLTRSRAIKVIAKARLRKKFTGYDDFYDNYDEKLKKEIFLVKSDLRMTPNQLKIKGILNFQE
ncbi:MAG: hypothetical protein ACXVKO_14570 [Bacteriovorax sp.]